MQNRVQSRLRGISHFLLAIGILILSLFAMTGISYVVISKGFGLNLQELPDLSLADFTVQHAYALKLGQFLMASSFIVAGFVCTKTFRQDFLPFTGLKTKLNPLHLIFGVILLISFIPIIDQLVRFNASWSFPEKMVSALQGLEESSNHTYDLFLKHNQGGQFIINLIIMSLLAAVGEEIFFRGILMRVLSKWFGNVHVGIFFSAVVFTIIHFQPYKFLPMLAFGLFLGYLYYRTRSLWLPIIVHAINNAIVVVADWSAKNGNELAIFKEDFQFPISSVFLCLIIVGGLGYFFWKRTSNNDFNYE
jgi:uncharacterized protein